MLVIIRNVVVVVVVVTVDGVYDDCDIQLIMIPVVTVVRYVVQTVKVARQFFF